MMLIWDSHVELTHSFANQSAVDLGNCRVSRLFSNVAKISAVTLLITMIKDANVYVSTKNALICEAVKRVWHS